MPFLTPENGADAVTSRRADLEARISGLYRRINEKTLTPADILTDIPYRFDPRFVERIYRKPDELEQRIPGFAATYALFRFFDPDALVLDVGAHWGYSAIAMRHRGCVANILSVEAMPLNRPALERIRALDGKYDFLNVAASNEAGAVTFYLPVVNDQVITGIASTGGTLIDRFVYIPVGVAEQHPPADGQPDRIGVMIVDVQTRTLDDIVAGRRVAAVKMDVEGHEVRALQGAGRLIAEQKPMLMIEGGALYPGVVSMLTDAGYFYCQRTGTQLCRGAPQIETDGFWLHQDRAAEYKTIGLLAEP
jgi:FkbM family methyltransferase